ncbi:YceI family protein [Azospirillum oleiclasticum]|nr:YceI family protein [Azospirillum oleiclasticum]
MRILPIPLVLLILWSGAAAAEPRRYVIDPEHATVAFLVRHIGYASVLASFLKLEGAFTYDHDARTLDDLVVSIDARSVFSNHAARDEHVRGPDFLDSGRNPVIRFVGTRAEPTGDATGRVYGELTVRGTARPVEIAVTRNKMGPYPWGENYVVGISARTTLKRSDFGMTYGLEGDLVGDEVEVIIELEAIRRP